MTCAYVESALNGARYCAECLFRGNVNSPISIGRMGLSDYAGGTGGKTDYI